MGSILITRSNPSQGLPATAKSARSRGRVEMLAQLACVGYRFTRSRSPVCNGVAYHPDPAGGANECRRPIPLKNSLSVRLIWPLLALPMIMSWGFSALNDVIVG